MTTQEILQGVHDWTLQKVVYDISEHNPTGGPNNDGKFTLEYILSNAGTLIPVSVRKGGMSIKFVHTSDNKYVQYRLTASEWSTDVADWKNYDVGDLIGNAEMDEVFGGEVAVFLTDVKGNAVLDESGKPIEII